MPQHIGSFTRGPDGLTHDERLARLESAGYRRVSTPSVTFRGGPTLWAAPDGHVTVNPMKELWS